MIYATAIGRHLLKETSAERQGDDLHINETLQETMMSCRQVRSYRRLPKARQKTLTFIYTQKNLQKKYGLDMSEEELFKKAEAHALKQRSYSESCKAVYELQKTGL